MTSRDTKKTLYFTCVCCFLPFVFYSLFLSTRLLLLLFVCLFLQICCAKVSSAFISPIFRDFSWFYLINRYHFFFAKPSCQFCKSCVLVSCAFRLYSCAVKLLWNPAVAISFWCCCSVRVKILLLFCSQLRSEFQKFHIPANEKPQFQWLQGSTYRSLGSTLTAPDHQLQIIAIINDYL